MFSARFTHLFLQTNRWSGSQYLFASGILVFRLRVLPPVGARAKGTSKLPTVVVWNLLIYSTAVRTSIHNYPLWLYVFHVSFPTGTTSIDPATSRVTGGRSVPLSYVPMQGAGVRLFGPLSRGLNGSFPPNTSHIQRPDSGGGELNPQRQGYEPCRGNQPSPLNDSE